LVSVIAVWIDTHDDVELRLVLVLAPRPVWSLNRPQGVALDLAVPCAVVALDKRVRFALHALAEHVSLLVLKAA
jgi:hypothetical protein